MRLRYILFFALSGVALLPVLSLAIWVSVEAEQRKNRLVEDTHLLLARNLGGALERYARDVRSGFELASKTALANLDQDLVAELLEDLNFVHLCVAEATTGRIAGGIFPDEFPCPERVPEKRFEVFKSLLNPERPVFSPVMPNPSGSPTIYLLMQDGDFILIGAISTQYFVERGSAIAFGKLGHAAIVDHTGSVLSHPRPDWVAS